MNVFLKEGTELEIKLIEELSSQHARVGDPVRLRVNEDIYCDNKLVIREGTKVKASVTVAEKRGMLGKSGKLDFSLNSVSSISGKEIPLRAVKNAESKNRQAGVIAGALLLSPLFLLMKGKDITIDAGKIFTAFVDDDMTIEIDENI
jgi:predicted DNA-binding antitoxin AbrB/MazE fold protein